MNKLLLNPFVKTLAVVALSVAGPAVLNAVDHPSGGLAATLSTHPVFAYGWMALSYGLHNAWSHYQDKNTPSPDNGTTVISNPQAVKGP